MSKSTSPKETMQDSFKFRDKYNWPIERLIEEAWASARRRCDMMGYILQDVALTGPPVKRDDYLEWTVEMLYEIPSGAI